MRRVLLSASLPQTCLEALVWTFASWRQPLWSPTVRVSQRLPDAVNSNTSRYAHFTPCPTPAQWGQTSDWEIRKKYICSTRTGPEQTTKNTTTKNLERLNIVVTRTRKGRRHLLYPNWTSFSIVVTQKMKTNKQTIPNYKNHHHHHQQQQQQSKETYYQWLGTRSRKDKPEWRTLFHIASWWWWSVCVRARTRVYEFMLVYACEFVRACALVC